jgi:integrase
MIGAGAVGGAFALPWLKAKLGADRLVAAGTAGTAITLVLFGLAHDIIIALLASVIAGDLMFRRSNGQPWRASQQARPMAEACARARIEPTITFHGLRHSYASQCAANGLAFMILAQNLGHRDTKMVEKHYAHYAPSHVADQIRKLAPKFGRVERKVVPIG